MNFETSLYYVTHHSETIIQWLFLLILLLAGFVIARGLFAKKTSVASTTHSSSTEMQEFLQKILERTSKLDAVASSNLTTASAAQVDEQIQILKRDLTQRDDEIQKLKAAGSPQASVDAAKVDARIKELEAKLAEYEILEDDIADLSLFKEENMRLKMELDKLKSGAPVSAGSSVGAPSTPALTPPPPTLPVSGEEIVAEFAEAVTQETTPSGTEPLQAPQTGNPMADFESAMKLEKKMHGGESEAALAPQASPSALGLAESDDLFAEFSTPTPSEESVDTDKLVAEIGELSTLAPGPAGKALEENIDTDKLVLEANFGKS